MINSGRSRCEILQSCLWELTFLSAIAECEIRAIFLDSKSNRISDHLSRWNHSDFHKEQFFNLARNIELHENLVREEMFEFINNW